MALALHHVFEILQFSASKPSTAREVRGIVTHAYKAHCGSSRCSRAGIAGRSFSHRRRHLQRAYPTAMIWPVQKQACRTILSVSQTDPFTCSGVFSW